MARWAGFGFADLALGELVKEGLAGLAARMSFQDFAAELAQVLEPWAQVFGQLFVYLAAKSLCDRGAFSGGGDGDLQIAAADDRTEIEIAIGNVIDTVTNDISLNAALDKQRR